MPRPMTVGAGPIAMRRPGDSPSVTTSANPSKPGSVRTAGGAHRGAEIASSTSTPETSALGPLIRIVKRPRFPPSRAASACVHEPLADSTADFRNHVEHVRAQCASRITEGTFAPMPMTSSDRQRLAASWLVMQKTPELGATREDLAWVVEKVWDLCDDAPNDAF